MKNDDKKIFKRYWMFYHSKIYLLILILCAVIFINYNWIISVLLMFLVIGLFFWEFIKEEESLRYIEEYAKSVTLSTSIENKNVYENFPLPYVMVNSKKLIEKFDLQIQNLFLDINLEGKNLKQLIPELDFDMEFCDTVINEVDYRVYIKPFESGNNESGEIEQKYMLYFWDNSENVDLKAKLYSEKTVVSIIFIDNYDEVLGEIEEVRRPLLKALIDRKLNTFAQEVGGVIKSFEKDKYLLIMSYEQLDIVRSGKFEILDKIREVNMGNKLPVTLSIGVGLSDESLFKCMEYARMAIDLALGRGGDQAVVKDDNKYNFYGGTAKEVEKNERVRARVKAFALKELIQEAEYVIIMGHKNPDFDSLGATVGIMKVCRMFEKPANIILNEVTPTIKELYDRLTGIDEYKENVFINTEEVQNRIVPNTLVIVVDVNRYGVSEAPEIFNNDVKVVVLDHHRRSADSIENAVLTYIETYASSTCELITEILQYIDGNIKFKPFEAHAPLSGITLYTKNFVVKTGARTFDAAAFLKRSGADSIRVRTLFQGDIEGYEARAMTVSKAEFLNNGIAIAICPQGVENPLLVAAQASDELLTITDVKASFVLCQAGERVSISARSLSQINVQVLMEQMGGGGHQTVAAAQVRDKSLEETKVWLIELLQDYLQSDN